MIGFVIAGLRKIEYWMNTRVRQIYKAIKLDLKVIKLHL